MRISLILPAKNEVEGLRRTLPGLCQLTGIHEIIVVDDGSTDGTADLAREHGVTVLSSPYSMGNGASIKRGARAATGDVFVFLDADAQHDPALVPRLLERLAQGYDMVVGARGWDGQASVGRGLANGLYNRIASVMTGFQVADLTSGFRAVRAEKFREFLHLLPNGFSTPTTTTLAFIKAGYNVTFEPAEARQRVGSSKIRLARDGVKFLLIILKIVTLYSPLRVFLPVSIASFVLGAGYAAWTIATQSHVTNSSVLLIVLAVIVFLVGLVSEQISALRSDVRR